MSATTIRYASAYVCRSARLHESTETIPVGLPRWYSLFAVDEVGSTGNSCVVTEEFATLARSPNAAVYSKQRSDEQLQVGLMSLFWLIKFCAVVNCLVFEI